MLPSRSAVEAKAIKQFSTRHNKTFDLSSTVIVRSGLFILNIRIVHHENLNHSSWKSPPFIIKIWANQHENLDRSTWISQPFKIKISTVQRENLDRSSWKSGPFSMKISTVQQENNDGSAWNLNFRLKWRCIKLRFETLVQSVGAILRNDLPAELKNAETLNIYKLKIKLWSQNYRACKICLKSIKTCDTYNIKN